MRELIYFLWMEHAILELQKKDITYEQAMLYPLPEPLLFWVIKKRIVLRYTAEGLQNSIDDRRGIMLKGMQDVLNEFDKED